MVRPAAGRLRRWVRVENAPPDGAARFLRVVLLEDARGSARSSLKTRHWRVFRALVTVHNAFFDRGFTPPEGDAP